MNTIMLILTCLSPALQDSWRDTHRVHLRNGQFLDGRIEAEGEREVIFRWNPTALLRIRRMEIDRIEELKIRPLAQVVRKPAERNEKPPTPDAPVPPAPTETIKEAPPAPRAESDADRVIARLLVNPDATFDLMMKELRALGLDGARSLIAGLPSMDAQRTELVLSALDAMRDVKLEGEIRTLLEAKRPDLRVAACRLLANRGATGAIRSITPLLKDVNPGVRVAALSALPVLGDETQLETIASLSLDPEPSVRERAFRSAEDLSLRLKLDNDLVGRWLNLQGRGPRGTVAEFVNAIGRLAERSGEGFPKRDVEGRFVEILSDRDDAARAAAAHALGSLKGSESAAEAIVRALEGESNAKVLQAMCESLGRLKMRRGIEPLIELLKSDSNDVRSAALRALERMTGAGELGPDPQKWTEWLRASQRANNP